MDTAKIDTSLETLTRNKKAWAVLPIARKREYLESIRANTTRVARSWVEAAVAAKGLSMDEPLAGEEWTSGPYAIVSLCRALDETLRRLDEGQSPIDGYSVSTTTTGQVTVDVFPTTTEERLLYSGVRAQVWMQPGTTPETLEDTVATFYRDPDPEGDLCVVLAAGNISSIAPFDIIHEMFNERKVVAVKMNPVNDYLGEFLEIVFADLIEDGYLRFDYGGVDVGIYLTNHPSVDSIHITGSVSTYEAIVFGSGDDRALNKQQDRPVNSRSIEAELGGVGPVIVVPGPWSKRDLRYQAEQIVSTKLHNCGFNCIAAQVIVMPEGWEHTDTLVDEIRVAMARATDRVPYYPGATDRTGAAIDRPSGVEAFGGRDQRYLVTHLDANRLDEVMFDTEVFAPVLGVVTLPSPDVASYLKKAVRFANERLNGTLGANILIHPRTEKRERSAFDQALADLKFGTIAINTWTGVAYFLPTCTWGAYPGHSRQDIQSGSGTVHNALMFGAAQKSVVRGPFAPAERAWLKGQPNLSPKPVFFVTNRQAHVIGERLIAYMDSGSKADLARVASAALRG